MEINHKFWNVNGAFETETGELVCVGLKKYNAVLLCFKANMNIPFAEIRLHSEDLAVDADAVFDDAVKLGDEIARRWNENKKFALEPIDILLFCPKCNKQHVDAPEPSICQECGAGKDEHNNTDNGTCPEFTAWLNPPHKSHRCKSCNFVWRPSDFPTNGVEVIKTCGTNDGDAKSKK